MIIRTKPFEFQGCCCHSWQSGCWRSSSGWRPQSVTSATRPPAPTNSSTRQALTRSSISIRYGCRVVVTLTFVSMVLVYQFYRFSFIPMKFRETILYYGMREGRHITHSLEPPLSLSFSFSFAISRGLSLGGKSCKECAISTSSRPIIQAVTASWSPDSTSLSSVSDRYLDIRILIQNSTKDIQFLHFTQCNR